MAIKKVLNKSTALVLGLILLGASANLIHAKSKKKNQQISQDYSTSLFGTEDQSEAFYIQDTDDGAQIVQQFKWQPEEGVLKYFFQIEAQNKDGQYEELQSLETEETVVSIPLTAGNYRYKITVYNFLGVAELETEWIPVEVVKAYLPEIKDVSPTQIYLEEEQDGIFTVNGSELRPDTQFVFADGKGRSKLVAKILETDPKNKKVKLQFDPKEIDTRKYSLIAKNTGGLTGSYYPVTVQYKKPMDFDISAGYSIPIIMFDETFPNYLGSNVFPLSLSAKANFMPFKHNFGYLGIGAFANYTRMFYDAGNYSVDGNMVIGLVNFVYQFPIRIKNKNDPSTKRHFMTLEVHGGAGITYFADFVYHFSHGIKSKPLNSMNLTWDVGGAVAVYVTKRLFVEAQVDYIMAVASDMTMGMLLPTAAVGWQF